MWFTQKMAALSVRCCSAELLKGPPKGGHSSAPPRAPIAAPPHLAKDPRGNGYLRRFREASEGGPGVPPLCLSTPPHTEPLSQVPWSCLWSDVLRPSMTPWPLLSSSPFDTESFLVSPSPPGKFSIGSRKGSLYNWTPPNTPSFRERYYLVSEPPWVGMWWAGWDWGWGV